jgi:hypothetical protein
MAILDQRFNRGNTASPADGGGEYLGREIVEQRVAHVCFSTEIATTSGFEEPLPKERVPKPPLPTPADRQRKYRSPTLGLAEGTSASARTTSRLRSLCTIPAAVPLLGASPYHMTISGFPFLMGTMLWKTMCASREIVAWRGLQHGACKSGTGENFS